MKKRLMLTFVVLAVIVLAVPFQFDTPLQHSKAQTSIETAGGLRYRVTVTNITRGQPLTPALVMVHKQGFTLFTEGSPASPELVPIAEDADLEPMIASATHNTNVGDIKIISGTGPVVPPGSTRGAKVLRPGESASVIITASGTKRLISLVGMLATTNDGFYALNGVGLPNQGTEIHYSAAWDSGSEANDEDCATIPGPPCGNFFVRNTVGAEGYVHIHAGIHGILNLVPAVSDWRNPVAKITIQRI